MYRIRGPRFAQAEKLIYIYRKNINKAAITKLRVKNIRFYCMNIFAIILYVILLNYVQIFYYLIITERIFIKIKVNYLFEHQNNNIFDRNMNANGNDNQKVQSIYN